ncbi:MAG: YdjY domain-containing protein [Fimbriiglobus sp.]
MRALVIGFGGLCFAGTLALGSMLAFGGLPGAKSPSRAAVPAVNDIPVSFTTEEEEKPKGEPLPPAPKADDKNTHKPLLPDGSLILEVKVDPTDAKKTVPVRLLVKCQVCKRDGFLEVLVCKKNTKEHEAILSTAVDAKLIHSGLLALKLNPGSPVQYLNAKGDEDYKAASGPTVKVQVHYTNGGKTHTHVAQEWIQDQKTKKPMAHQWVFTGSRFIKDEDNPEKPPYYTANNGEVIAISNFMDSMLDLPVKISKDEADLMFDANTPKIPSLFSQVWLILEPGPKQ